MLWQSGKRVSIRVPALWNGPGNFIILEKLDKGVVPQMIQEECCDYVWNGGGGEGKLRATFFTSKIPSSQQKVAKVPGFVARQSQFEFSSSSNSC